MGTKLCIWREGIRVQREGWSESLKWRRKKHGFYTSLVCRVVLFQPLHLPCGPKLNLVEDASALEIWLKSSSCHSPRNLFLDLEHNLELGTKFLLLGGVPPDLLI